MSRIIWVLLVEIWADHFFHALYRQLYLLLGYIGLFLAILQDTGMYVDSSEIAGWPTAFSCAIEGREPLVYRDSFWLFVVETQRDLHQQAAQGNDPNSRGGRCFGPQTRRDGSFETCRSQARSRYGTGLIRDLHLQAATHPGRCTIREEAGGSWVETLNSATGWKRSPPNSALGSVVAVR